MKIHYKSFNKTATIYKRFGKWWLVIRDESGIDWKYGGCATKEEAQDELSKSGEWEKVDHT